MKSETPASPGLSDDLVSGLFTNMVMQYASMAFMFMGKAPHPETKETVRDLDAAQMFISQLEMLQVKTKGNLTPQEEMVLKQSLMTTRLAFVDTIEQGAAAPAGEQALATPSPASPPTLEAAPAPPIDPNATAAEADERKKFVKKY